MDKTRPGRFLFHTNLHHVVQGQCLGHSADQKQDYEHQQGNDHIWRHQTHSMSRTGPLTMADCQAGHQ